MLEYFPLTKIIKGITENWEFGLVVGLILFSVYVGLNTIQDESLQQISENTNTTSLYMKGSWFSAWALALTSTTPSWRFNYLEDMYVVGLNDIPFPDMTDIIGLLPVFIIIWFMRRKRFHQVGIYDLLIKFLIIAAAVIVLFLLWKHIVYRIYIYSSEQLGLTASEAVEIREGVLKGLEKVTLPMFFISLFGGYALFKTVKKK